LAAEGDDDFLEALAEVEGLEDLLLALDVLDEAVGDDVGERVVVADSLRNFMMPSAWISPASCMAPIISSTLTESASTSSASLSSVLSTSIRPT